MGQTWKDTHGHEWTARIAIGDADRLRIAGRDLLDPKAVGEIWQDPLKVVQLLVDVHEKQWSEAGMTAGDFAELATETAEVAIDAVAALEAALADFFHRLRRPALAAVVAKASEMARAADEAAIAKVNGPEVRRKMGDLINAAMAEFDRQLEKTGDASGSSPAS